jgi:phosphatidylinositol alpha-1,6-mannosyltransferase
MRLVVSTEARFLRTPDGRVWSCTTPTRRDYAPLRADFDTVRVVARVLDTPTVPAGALRVDGDGVEVWPVPWYVGPRGYLRRRRAVRRAVLAAADPADAVLVTAPSVIGGLLAGARIRLRLPYAVRVVGDPYDVFARGVVRHPLRPLLRRHLTRLQRRLCLRASAVGYVTERTLQLRYPAGPGAVSVGFSNVVLDGEAFARAPRPAEPGRADYALVCVGSLDQRYKGVETLLAALATLKRTGSPVRLTHVGDGRHRADLELLAARLGVADRVSFVGAVPPGGPVRDQLAAADLFVLPSRTEGLPRALVEAMAAGLPAIATAVGGIPELLAGQYLVPRDAPARLAATIRRLLGDPPSLAAASAENLGRARDFAPEAVAQRRAAFHRAVAATGAPPTVQPAPTSPGPPTGSLSTPLPLPAPSPVSTPPPDATLPPTQPPLPGQPGPAAGRHRRSAR